MNKITYILSLLIIALVNCYGQSINKEIENIILYDTDITYELTPGFIIGVIDGDSTYVESFGSKADDRRTKLERNDVFEIGSLSKLFTALLIDIAVSEDLIGLSDKLNDFIPFEYTNPRLKDLSISKLLNHQSGLPKRPYGFGEKQVDPQNPYQYYTKDDLLKSYAKYVPEEAGFTYSHMNYALLEIVLENLYAKSYAKIIKNKILDPLGMKETFVNYKEDRNVLTSGLDRSGSIVSPWMFNSFAGSEGIKSTMSDMMIFMRVHLGLDLDPISQICSDNFNAKHTSFNDKIVVSNGWQILKVSKKLNASMHTGTTSGHSAFIGITRETGTGVVILSNSTFGTKDLGLLVLRMINHNWKRKPN